MSKCPSLLNKLLTGNVSPACSPKHAFLKGCFDRKFALFSYQRY